MTDTLNEKHERAFSLIIILVLLVYFAVFAIVNFAGFAYFCNADMYEDTLVARLMWEQKTLFPENYIFGNQYTLSRRRCSQRCSTASPAA